MAEPITPEALAEARELSCNDGHAIVDSRGRWCVEFDDYGIATLIAHIRAAATAAERERWIACVPGGSWVDPQQVADEIRRGG